MPIISKETWEKFDPTEKKEIRELYSSLINALKQEQIGSEEHLRLSSMQDRYISLFGIENLQPQPLTYEDVARELFKEGAWQPHDYASKYDFDENSEPTYFLNCTSRKQAEKLLAINKLLNVAKFLNKDWKPDWKNRNELKFGIGLLDGKIKIEPVAIYNLYFVYFRTKELAEQAIQILGEDTVRLALTTEY